MQLPPLKFIVSKDKQIMKKEDLELFAHEVAKAWRQSLIQLKVTSWIEEVEIIVLD